MKGSVNAGAMRSTTPPAKLLSRPFLVLALAVLFGFALYHLYSTQYISHDALDAHADRLPIGVPEDGELIGQQSFAFPPVTDEDEPHANDADVEVMRPAKVDIPTSSPLEETSDSTLDTQKYRELFSLTTSNREFVRVNFIEKAYNGNLIPHPTHKDKWVMVAQHEQYLDDVGFTEEIICSASLKGDTIVCDSQPSALPVNASIWGQCDDEKAYVNFRPGPRDARVFWGPESPYIIYGSQSQYTCLGLWVQDFRMLADQWSEDRPYFHSSTKFKEVTELRRPTDTHQFEKNYFLFWDAENYTYVHNDISPDRVYARVEWDGSVVEDIAPQTSSDDKACMEKYMPQIPEDESIHQATNSLSVTLCNRTDPACHPNDDNTFIMHIFQHKTYRDAHGMYEPYVILFRRSSPFALHAISTKALWIHGRGNLTAESDSILYKIHEDWEIPEGHTEMFYLTSMSWKSHELRYHGYLDDVLFLVFGIEDSRVGLIDIRAEDLFKDLAVC